MSSVPASRSLETVLRGALTEPGSTLRVIAGTYDSPPSADARYANVVINGEHLTIPNLNAQAAGVPGQLVYVLADRSHMWVIGQMREISAQRINGGTANAVFPNATLSNVVTVTHGLPATPRAAIVQTTVADCYGVVDPGSVGPTTFNFRAHTNTPTPINATRPFYWTAIG